MSVNITNVAAELFPDFETWWAGTGATDIAWPNKPFDPEESESFVRIKIHTTKSSMMDIGQGQSCSDKMNGMVSWEIFVQAESGVFDVQAFADLIFGKYNRRTMINLYFDAGWIVREGQDKNTGMYQLVLVIPFHSIQ